MPEKKFSILLLLFLPQRRYWQKNVILFAATTLLFVYVMGGAQPKNNKIHIEFKSLSKKYEDYSLKVQKSFIKLNQTDDITTIQNLKTALMLVKSIKRIRIEAKNAFEPLLFFVNKNKIKLLNEGLSKYVLLFGISNFRLGICITI